MKKLFFHLGVFFLLIGALVPPIINPFVEGMAQYMPIKVLMLSLSCVFSFAYSRALKTTLPDLFLYLYILYSLCSIYWSDFSFFSISVTYGLWVSYFLLYLIVRNLELEFRITSSVVLFVLLLEIIYMQFGYSGYKSINGGYIVGHFSSVLLFFLHDRGLILIISCFLTYGLFSGQRFVAISLIALLKKPKAIIFLGVLFITALMYISFLIETNNPLYTYLLGYRISELNVLKSQMLSSVTSFCFGYGFGQNETLIDLGTKGEVAHIGIFHNFYFSILQNTGIIGFFLFVVFIWSIFSYRKSHLHVGLAAFLVLAAVDSHRDGVWAIFLFAGISLNYSLRKRNEQNINFS